MNTNKKHINVVWFKRDLRLQDNEAIFNATKSDIPTLLLYVFEKSLENDSHYSSRHWNFIKQSLVDINKQLEQSNTQVLAVSSEKLLTKEIKLSKGFVKTIKSIGLKTPITEFSER